MKSSSNPDSIRFLLALALRNTGTMDGRLKALGVFQQIRVRYYETPRYHMEIARTYLEGGRRSDAAEEFKKALRLDPTSVDARIQYADLLLRSALRIRDLGIVTEALSVVTLGLEGVPENRDLLFEKSLLLCLDREMDPTDAALKSAEGCRCAVSILERNPADLPARFLEGVHWLDLGDPDRADSCFRAALLGAPVEVKEAYVTPRYHAPDSTLARIASLAPSDRVGAIRAYWVMMDPSPLTLLNETELEYWKRMTLADFYYGDPGRGLHGWETPRGEIFVRYGPPQAEVYTQATFEGGTADVQQDTRLDARIHHDTSQSLSLPFLAPTQTWAYSWNGRVLQFAFVDRTLQDQFENVSPAAVGEARANIPSVTFGAQPGEIRICFASGAGMRAKEGKTRESLFVALPAWAADADWWNNSSIKLSLIDAAARPLVLKEGPLEPDMIVHFYTNGRGMAVTSGSANLDPGQYTASVEIHAPSRQGTFNFPLSVRDLSGDSLMVSELRLALPGQGEAEENAARAPNPGGIVLRDGKLMVLFEIYNLTPDATGQASYQTEYAVLPRAWALAWTEDAAAGNQLDPALRLGRLGTTMGGVTLSDRNFLPVDLPGEPDAAGALRHRILRVRGGGQGTGSGGIRGRADRDRHGGATFRHGGGAVPDPDGPGIRSDVRGGVDAIRRTWAR